MLTIRLFFLNLCILAILLAVSGQKPLICDSINAVSRDVIMEFVYLKTTDRDCAFMFQSPVGTNINVQVNGMRRTRNDLCGSSPLRIYHYFRDNLVSVDENFCDNLNKLMLTTDSNFVLIVSPRSSGSFYVQTSVAIKPRVFSNTEPIIGMFAPPPQPSELFIPSEFRAQPIQNQGFVPSFGVPGLSDSYGAPLPRPFSLYPGRPTVPIELTTSFPTGNITAVMKEEVETTTRSTSIKPTPEKITSSTNPPFSSVSAFASTSVNGTEAQENVIVKTNGSEIKLNSQFFD